MITVIVIIIIIIIKRGSSSLLRRYEERLAVSVTNLAKTSIEADKGLKVVIIAILIFTILNVIKKL